MTQCAWCSIVAAFGLSGSAACAGSAFAQPDRGGPPGETCALATQIDSFPFDSGVIDNSTFAGSAFGGSCDPAMPAQMAQDLWYRWTAEETSIVKIEVETGFYTGVAQVHTGTSCASLSLVTCALGAAPGIIPISFQATAGQTYYLQAGRRGGPGMITAWTTVRIQPLPANDECVNAIELFEETPVVGNTALATSNPMDPSFACPLGGAGVGSLWYSFEAPAERVVITTIDTVFTTLPVTKSDGSLLAAYTGQCGSLTQIGCKGKSDYFPVGQSGAGHSTLDLEGLTIGQTYLVQVATPPARTPGALVIRMSVPLHCPVGSSLESENCAQMVNNSCGNSMPIALGATMCGTFWSHNGSSDTDIYLLKLAKPTTVPFRIQSRLPMRCRVYPFVQCLIDTPLVDFTTPCQGLDCDSEASIALSTGWYQIVVQVADTVQGFDVCETGRNDYLLSLGTPPNCDGDANGDAIVNFDDITEVIANWLRACP